MRQTLDKLSRDLGYDFKDPQLLDRALTHRSAASDHNERLEFLGDAVLGFVVSSELYARFPDADEGRLSRLRAALVRGENLAVRARDLHLGDYLTLGPGELKSGGFRRDSILADALEAVIGALCLDGGIDTARRFVLDLLGEQLAVPPSAGALKDPKTRLQEYLQSRQLSLPTYTVLSVEGEAHAQDFLVSCQVDGLDEPTVGAGPSRRKAEQDAAAKALKALGQ